MSHCSTREHCFTRFAWFCLSYNVFVILWGAVVRASHSGAGCGANWPLCGGEIVPEMERASTLIEFIHRLSSGLCLVFALWLFFWAKKKFSTHSPVFRASLAVVALTVVEALVGAGLVLFELVGQNASPLRAIVIALHLVNTMFLLAALALVAQWSRRAPNFSGFSWRWVVSGPNILPLLVLTSILVASSSGAVTALADTLFGGVAEPGEHFLLQLRVWHPAFAALSVLLIFFWANYLYWELAKVREVKALLSLVLLQVCLGLLNIWLEVPIWLQIVHLGVADVIWVLAVLLAERQFCQDSPGCGSAFT